MGVVVGQMTPIALLEDRSGEALDNWLIWNPQIQYMMRDRGRCFTESINRLSLYILNSSLCRASPMVNMFRRINEEAVSLSGYSYLSFYLV